MCVCVCVVVSNFDFLREVDCCLSWARSNLWSVQQSAEFETKRRYKVLMICDTHLYKMATIQLLVMFYQANGVII